LQAVAEGDSSSTSYEVIGKLADGDVAELFLARSTGAGGIERLAAVKRIPRKATQNTELVKLFLEEARLAARLQHPNVAQIYEVGKLGGSYFYAMEYINGETLRALVEHAKAKKIQIPIRSILTIAAGAAEALHHAHERRGLDGKPLEIVHGDVTPTNLLVSREGIVKLVDFGIAKARSRSHAPAPVSKVSYWAPEQCRNEPLDRRCDLFSLGVVLWELLTLEDLYNRGGDARTRAAIENEPPVPPSTRRYDVPPELDTIVRRLIEKSAGERYQTAGELLAALEHCASKLSVQLSTQELARMMRLWFGNVADPIVPPAENPLVIRSEPVPADIAHPAADPADALLESVGNASLIIRAAAPEKRDDKVTLVPDTVAETRENFEQIRDRILATARRKKETTKQALAASTPATSTPPTGMPNVGTHPPPTSADAASPRPKRETLNTANNAFAFITNVSGKAAEPMRRATTPAAGHPTAEAHADAAAATAQDAASTILAATAAAAKANAARFDSPKGEAAQKAEAMAVRVEAARAAAVAKAEEAARADEDARAAAARATSGSNSGRIESARSATPSGRLVVVVEESNVEAAKVASASLELEKLNTTGQYGVPAESVLRDAEARLAEAEKAAAAESAPVAGGAATAEAAKADASKADADAAAGAKDASKTDAKNATTSDAKDATKADAKADATYAAKREAADAT
jgi:serine/threonine-protein kinase